MLEVLSNLVTVNTNNAIPLNTVEFQKGCAIKKTGTTTLSFRSSGVYLVNVDATAVSLAETGAVSLQIAKNGNLIGIPSTETVSNTTYEHTLSTNALVYVPDTSCCRCSNPVDVTIQNIGNDAVFTINVVVTKVR